MSYTHLTNVASFNTLLAEIRDFLVATGDWTIHANLVTPDEGVASGGTQLVASNDDVLVGLRATTAGVGANRLYLFDGIPPYSSTLLDSLPGNSGIRYTDALINNASEPAVRHIQQVAGPYPNVHLFSNDPSTYLHVAIEVQAGIWKHLMVGNLIKFGTWTGGGYYGAQSWSLGNSVIDNPGSTQHSFPFDNNQSFAPERQWTVHYQDGGAANWIQCSAAPVTLNSVVRQAGRGSFRGGAGYLFKVYPESPFSGRIPLGPILIGRRRTEDSPATHRWIGQVPDVRQLNITNVAPAESLMIGSDEWVCFPLVAKQGAVNQYSSQVEGVAYLKHP